MSLPTSTNDVTARKLSSVIDGLWTKIKSTFAKPGDITTAIQALDVSSVGGDGKYISAISETDGKISATATTMDTTPTASSTKAVTSGGVNNALDKKVNIANVDISGQSTTILALVQTMATSQIHYKRFYTSSDGGSANISDKPTGTTNAGFMFEAYCNRYVSSSDWRYVVLCYVQANRPKIAWIKNGDTSISWQDLNTNTDTKVTQTADNSSTGTGFELLFSATADNTTRTEAARKSSRLTFQPSTGTLTATKFSGPLTGNVTGNCSGSSGSCTGNAATATTATNANITRTADTTNGDKLQIGTGTAVNITNAKHAASADSASKVTNKLTLKIKTGSTEGTNLYTYDGSAAKALDIKQGSNITLTAAAGSLTIAGTDTKNTVGVGPVTHTYDTSYYVPFTSSSPTSASNAQSYTSMSGEGYSNTALLSFVDDPVKGMQGFITGNLIGRFNGVPPQTADGKLVTVGMDGQLVVSSILEADVALTSNVEPLLTQSRGVAKLQDSANGAITGFYCDSGSGGSDKYGIRFGSGGGLTYNNSYIIHTVTGDASGYMHLFEGIAQYAYSATSASSATNANITRTADTTNGDKLQIGTGTAVNITNAKHAASADSASKVANKLTLKIKTGSTEGTNLYTYDGSAAKTLDIKQGSNITLTAAAGSLTIAGTDTKNTVGVGAASHAYDHNYYVPFTTSTQSAASNAQSYTELTGEMETRTPLLRFVDDPIKGMQGFMAGNQIGRFNGVPPETADGKLVTVGMDGQLVVSSILETDVALSSNVEPLLTVGRKVIKTGSTGGWDEAAPEPNGEILGFNCSKTASNNRDGFGIALNVNGTMTGGLTFTETVNGTKSTSYILAYANGAITGGKKFHFYGSSDYAITAGTAVSAGSAGSATNVALTGSVKTTSTSNGDTIQFRAGSGTAGTVTIVNAKHAASADSATSASYLKDATNTSRTAKVSYYGSGAISGSNAVQYLAGFYTPDGSSSSTICDVPHAKMLMYIFGQLYSSRCTTINSNHTLSLSDFSNNAEGSLYMYQNVTAASKTLTWTYRHTQGLGTTTGTVEKGCTAVFILDDATNAVFTRIM